MARVTWDNGSAYEMVLEARADAPPAAVYRLLADLPAHLDWGGRRQRRSFRLTALSGPAPAATGTQFSSEGVIPMTRTRSRDDSTVVAAEPPSVFEFHTDSTMDWPHAGRSETRWEHRYEIRPHGAGSQVRYRLRLAAANNPPLRMRAPLMRTMTHRVMIPLLCRRGFDNLLATAAHAHTAATDVPTRRTWSKR